MGLAVLPDGGSSTTPATARSGCTTPRPVLSPIINTIPVYQHDEDGLQFVAVDPDFGTNQWVYIYYVPLLATPVDDPTHADRERGQRTGQQHRPERLGAVRGLQPAAPGVRMVETPTPHLDMTTEQQILRVDVDRGICCHVGGDIEFDDDGMLYLTRATTPTPADPTGSRRSTTRRARPSAAPATTPADRPGTPTTCEASCFASGSTPTGRTPSPRETCSRPAPRSPDPRSISWGSATRSDST